MARKGKRSLSNDDLSVWQHATRSARPLRKSGSRVLKVPGAPTDQGSREAGEREVPFEPEKFRVGEAVPSSKMGLSKSPYLATALNQHPVRMDAKAFGKLKKGKLRPERKLDLHGMTVAQAHPALLEFVKRAHADGLRLVVIVTGKGKTSHDDVGPIPVPRGVLRHQVPGWLHHASLRHLILQVTPAHVRHGGEGAYYVYLTRHR